MCLNQGLTEKEDGRDRGLLNLVGRKTAGTVTAGTDLTNSPISLLIPLQFWFCRSPRQALPIVSLNDETLELRVTLSPLANILFFNHVAPITVDAVATPISFIGGQ